MVDFSGFFARGGGVKVKSNNRKSGGSVNGGNQAEKIKEAEKSKEKCPISNMIIAKYASQRRLLLVKGELVPFFGNELNQRLKKSGLAVLKFDDTPFDIKKYLEDTALSLDRRPLLETVTKINFLISFCRTLGLDNPVASMGFLTPRGKGKIFFAVRVIRAKKIPTMLSQMPKKPS